MASKILDVSADIRKGPIGWLDYDAVKQANRSFIRSDAWEFRFTSFAPACYFPGNDFLRTRLKSVSVQTEDGAISEMTTDIRRFKVSEPITTGNHSGTFTLSHTDFADQSIIRMYWDIYCKIGDPDTNFAFSRPDVLSDAELIMYTGNRIPIRKYVMKDCYPQNVGDWINAAVNGEDPANLGDFDVTWQASNIKMYLLPLKA